MTSSVLENLRAPFAYLAGAGFSEGAADYSPQTFGNAFVEYESPCLLIRVVRDRGQLRLDFASPSDVETWFDLDLVLRVLNADEASRSVANTPDAGIQELSTTLEEWIRPIQQLFAGTYADIRKRLFEVANHRFQQGYGVSG